MKTSKLLEINDAQIWAIEFIKCKEKNNWALEDIDVDLMIGWFANAMAAQEFKDNKENQRLREILKLTKELK